MIVSKAYIMYHDDPVYIEYAKLSAESCNNVGLPWEYFEGYKPTDQMQLWENFETTANVRVKQFKQMDNGAAGCTATHAHLWKQIADNKECVVMLEHDGVMLHSIDHINIPDDKIVALGYKYYNWKNYDYKMAGPPRKLVDVVHNPGSHAYAIHHKVAQALVDEIEQDGITEAIDNRWFMHTRVNYTKTKMSIMDPIAGMGALRKSTIWDRSATHNNIEEMLPSFIEHFTSDIREKALIM
jgi:GR25 family glycosyltransferase involved in LPS biosynthesis